MGRYRTWDRRYVQHPFAPLLNEQLTEAVPEFLRAVGRRRQERLIAIVRIVVVLNEVPNVDFLLPGPSSKLVPRRNCFVLLHLLQFGGCHKYSFTFCPLCVGF